MLKGFETKAKLTKGCPFCGCKDIVTTSPDAFREDGLRCLWITCDNCGGRMSGYSEEMGDFDTAYKDALTKWNRRSEK